MDPLAFIGGDVALKHHEGGICCLKPTSQWGRVIFMESAFAEIVKKSVRGGPSQNSKGGCQWGETAPAGGGLTLVGVPRRIRRGGVSGAPGDT